MSTSLSPPFHGRIPPPPFSADALKQSALRNGHIYREFFNPVDGSGVGTATRLNGQLQIAGDDVRGMVASHQQSNIAAQRQVSQGLLLIDARRLVESSTYLCGLLKENRMKMRLIPGLTATLCQILLSSRLFSQIIHVNLPSWVTFIAYPVAGYCILKHERDISSAEGVSEGAFRLCTLVENGQPIYDRDLECFTGVDWDDTPWGKMEPEIR